MFEKYEGNQPKDVITQCEGSDLFGRVTASGAQYGQIPGGLKNAHISPVPCTSLMTLGDVLDNRIAELEREAQNLRAFRNGLNPAHLKMGIGEFQNMVMKL